MAARPRAPNTVPIPERNSAVTRLHRMERLLVTTFTGHVTGKIAEQVLQDIRREVPLDMSAETRPFIWIVDALQVGRFDSQDLRKPGSDLLQIIRDRIAPHMILLRVESASVFETLGHAAVILFARGICLSNGVKLHVLNSAAEVPAYVDNLRKEGVLR